MSSNSTSVKPFTNAQEALSYIMAGNSRVTARSKLTGTRFTYRVKKSRPSSPTYVSLLTGSDNNTGYTYLGTIFSEYNGNPAGNYKHNEERSPIRKDAPGARAWDWIYKQLRAGHLPENLELFHEGRCGKCARALTTPASLLRGLGETCYVSLGHAARTSRAA